MQAQRDQVSRGRAAFHQPSRSQGPDVRPIALIAIVVVLVVLILAGLSNCMGCGAEQRASTTSAPMTSVSTASQSGDSGAQSAFSESAASSEAPLDIPVQTATVNAQQGDVAYPVVQAAKLAFRDVDFAVDPARRNWNFDKTNGHKTLYLTFDDGPSENTEKVLDILDQYGCKATFFVTGQNPDYFPWIKEAYRRGHTIGLHSMTHDYESCYSSPEGFWAEFDAIGQVVKGQIGYVPCFIRFPGGVSNTISASYSEGIMTFLDADVQERGYQYYDWSLSCGDGAVLTAEETIAAGCEPTDEENVVYLLHDGSAKESTVAALPTIIEYYQAQGYSFEALDRSSLAYHHGIAN